MTRIKIDYLQVVCGVGVRRGCIGLNIVGEQFEASATERPVDAAIKAVKKIINRKTKIRNSDSSDRMVAMMWVRYICK